MKLKPAVTALCALLTLGLVALTFTPSTALAGDDGDSGSSETGGDGTGGGGGQTDDGQTGN